jgi:hypothetical protein
MAAYSHNAGWTVASLLPSLASGFSPGSSVGSRSAMAQVTTKPTALKPALAQQAPMSTTNAFHADLLNRILGQKLGTEIPKQPGTNPAVNSLGNLGMKYPSLLSTI